MCLTPAAITPPSLIAFKWGDSLFGRLNFYRLLPKKSLKPVSDFHNFQPFLVTQINLCLSIFQKNLNS